MRDANNTPFAVNKTCAQVSQDVRSLSAILIKERFERKKLNHCISI